MDHDLRDSKKFALSLFGLPAFDSLDELAYHLRYSRSLLYGMWQWPERFYRKYEIKKRNGGVRQISQPNASMKSAQRWIYHEILARLNVSRACKGFRRGESILENARSHSGANHLMLLDIQDFFPSIAPGRVYSLFRSIGYGSFASGILTAISTLDGGLPQGSPTSPMIANLVCLRLDSRLDGLAAHNNVVFTRYADDLTFSCHSPKNLQRIFLLASTIIGEEGFSLNSSKTRFMGLGRRREVTGLVLSDDRVGIGSQKYRVLRMEIFALTKLAEDEALTQVSRIQGWLSHLRDVDQNRYLKLAKLVKVLRDKSPSNKSLKSLEIVSRQKLLK